MAYSNPFCFHFTQWRYHKISCHHSMELEHVFSWLNRIFLLRSIATMRAKGCVPLFFQPKAQWCQPGKHSQPKRIKRVSHTVAGSSENLQNNIEKMKINWFFLYQGVNTEERAIPQRKYSSRKYVAQKRQFCEKRTIFAVNGRICPKKRTLLKNTGAFARKQWENVLEIKKKAYFCAKSFETFCGYLDGEGSYIDQIQRETWC